MHAHMGLACSKWQGSQCDRGRVSEVMRAERRQRARPQKACRLCTVRALSSLHLGTMESCLRALNIIAEGLPHT